MLVPDDAAYPTLTLVSGGAAQVVGRKHGALVLQTSSKVSKVHCQLWMSADGVAFVSESSTNGTWINDARMEKDLKYALKSGDQVSFPAPPGVTMPVLTFTLRGAMAYSKLSGDEQCIIFSQLCNVLEPSVALAFSSTSSELRALTPALRQQLRAGHEVVAALCLKMGHRFASLPAYRQGFYVPSSCKELREATKLTMQVARSEEWDQANDGEEELSAAELATLGTLGSVLPALEELCLTSVDWSEDEITGVPIYLTELPASPGGVQRLVEGLGAGALPALIDFHLFGFHVGNAGASALAAALGRGALPQRLKKLVLINAGIGDAGLVALAPALRRLPALVTLGLMLNPLGDEGLAALVAPPAAGAPLSQSGALPSHLDWVLEGLDLQRTHVTDAGCATLAAVLGSGGLLALDALDLIGIPASAAAKAAVYTSRGSDSDECYISRDVDL